MKHIPIAPTPGPPHSACEALARARSHRVTGADALVGYADPAAFRRVFRRETGETPGAQRTRATLRDGDPYRT